MQCYTEDPCVHCVVLQRLVHGELRVMRGQLGLLGGSVVKNPSPNAGDAGLIPGSGINPLGKETATHSSILAWRIPWTEEPGGLQSTGSQKSQT